MNCTNSRFESCPRTLHPNSSEPMVYFWCPRQRKVNVKLGEFYNLDENHQSIVKFLKAVFFKIINWLLQFEEELIPGQLLLRHFSSVLKATLKIKIFGRKLFDL